MNKYQLTLPLLQTICTHAQARVRTHYTKSRPLDTPYDPAGHEVHAEAPTTSDRALHLRGDIASWSKPPHFVTLYSEAIEGGLKRIGKNSM